MQLLKLSFDGLSEESRLGMMNNQLINDDNLSFESFVILKTLSSVVAFVMRYTRLAYDIMDLDGVSIRLLYPFRFGW